MNDRQKSFLLNTVVVTIITAVFIVVMYNMKDHVNKSEAIRAMRQLGNAIIKYRGENGMLPPEYSIKSMTENLEGSARLGKVVYRAMWISYDSPPETILAYTKKNYSSFLTGPGYVVLQLDGQVEWINEKPFEEILKQQQSQVELKEIEKTIQQKHL